MSLKFFLICVIAFVSSHASFAQTTYYWISTTASNWNNTTNWSTSSGGASCSCTPTSADNIIFNNAANGDCINDNISGASFASMSMTGYTGTFDLSNRNLNLSSSNNVTNTFSSGIFKNSTGSIDINCTANQSATTTFSGTKFGNGITLTVNSSNLYLNGSNFGDGSATFYKWGAAGSTNASLGGNTFNGPTKIALDQTGSLNRVLQLTTTFADTFNNSLLVETTGLSRIYIADGAGAAFNGNVTLNSTNGNLDNASNGIYFGNSGGTSTLLAGKTITCSAGYQGPIVLNNFKQLGTEALNFSMSVTTGSLSGSNSTFNGNFTFVGRRFSFSNSTFGGTSNSLDPRSGAASSTSTDNKFGSSGIAGSSTFIRTSNAAANFSLGMGGGDTYYHDVTFRYTGGGATCRIVPSSAGTSNYYGNITWDNNATGAMSFPSTSNLVGNINSTINSNSGTATFFKINLTKTTGSNVTLTTPVTVTSSMVLISGIMVTDPTNYILMPAWGGSPSNTCHINGTARTSAGAAFTFPIGDGTVYRPLGISSPAGSTFAGAYVGSPATGIGTALGAGLFSVSHCEYWKLERISGGGNVSVTLMWGAPNSSSCSITNPPTIHVGQWNGTQWVDMGGSGGGTATTGSVTSSGGITNYSAPDYRNFALVSTTNTNTLPVELYDFKVMILNSNTIVQWKTATEINNDFFSVERSQNGKQFKSLGEISGAGNSRQTHSYEFIDKHPIVGTTYFRLKQVDFDGTATYSEVITLVLESAEDSSYYAYPNPVKQGEVLITNYSGKAIIMNSIGLIIGEVVDGLKIDTSELNPGNYYLRFEKGNMVHLVVY